MSSIRPYATSFVCLRKELDDLTHASGGMIRKISIVRSRRGVAYVLLLVHVCFTLGIENSVHLCSCSDDADPSDPLKGCDPDIRLKRLQVGRIFSPGKVQFKYKLEVDRELPHPHVDFTLTKLMIPLPCLSGYGSCTYSLCGYEDFSIEKKICAAWDCKCPIRAGTYYSGLVSIRMPDLRAFGLAAYGPVNVEIKFKEGKQAVHCVSFDISVANPDYEVARQDKLLHLIDFVLPDALDNTTDVLDLVKYL